MLRIGRISYANCTPLFHALEALYPGSGYEYVSGVPARLNDLLGKGEIDVCPSSSIEFARHFDDYLILPDISISSCGPVKSVLLFSSTPIEELDGREILLSSESATSVNLLKILLRKRYDCNCSFRVASGNRIFSLSESPPMLLIGDSALKESQSVSGMLVYDLGELWYRWTGLPFVFALWLVNRRAVEEQGGEVRMLARQLVQAKKYAAENLGQIAENSPDAAWMGHELLLEYWKHNISYDLDALYCEGLKLFFRHAADMGLISRAPELAFYKDGTNCMNYTAF